VVRQETADSVSITKGWARDNVNTFFAALDTKFDVHERVTVGVRVLHDRAAVPTQTLSVNNYDANTTALTGMVAVHATRNLSVMFSAGQYLSSVREVSDSNFGLSIDPALRKELRYAYPEVNGRIGNSITRLAFSVRGQFDHGKSRPE
jgi:hypothetical protein